MVQNNFNNAGFSVSPPKSPGALAQRIRRMSASSESDFGSLDELSAVLVSEFYPADSTEHDKAKKLGQIAGLGVKMDTLKRELDIAVEEALSQDTSWSEVGRALDVAPSVAIRRYDPAARQRHRDAQRRFINTISGQSDSAE